VFVDLQMPEIDGLEVARRLRGRGGLPRTLLVAVTGLGQAENRRQTARPASTTPDQAARSAQVQALLAMRRGKDRRSGIA
jgi:CheY-like chemotaxis protein